MLRSTKVPPTFSRNGGRRVVVARQWAIELASVEAREMPRSWCSNQRYFKSSCRLLLSPPNLCFTPVTLFLSAKGSVSEGTS